MVKSRQIKQRARERVRGESYGIAFKLTIVLFVWQIVSGFWDTNQVPSEMTLGAISQFSFGLLTSSMISEIIVGVFGLGVLWSFVTWRRTNQVPEHPIKDSLRFWRRDTLIDVVVLYGVRYIFTLLWSLLLIIPGIYKSYAYSQADLLFADDVAKGNKIVSLTAYLTQSQHLMRGYKMRLFWLQLSFIGWWLLVLLTMGIAAIYVVPYYQAAMAEFYLELNRERPFMTQQAGDVVDVVDSNDEL